MSAKKSPVSPGVAPVVALNPGLVEALKSFAGFGRQKTLHAAWGAALRAGVDLGEPTPEEAAVAEASAVATAERLTAKGNLGKFDTADCALRRAQALRTLIWLRESVTGGTPNLGAMGAVVANAGSKDKSVWADLLEAAAMPVVVAEKAEKPAKAAKASKGTPIPEAASVPAPAAKVNIEGLVATALARGMSAADIAALVAAVA